MCRLARVTRAAADLAAPAAALGITRTQLYTRLRRFGLPL
jgi:transcriptional regulator of acetoin/glycerol metabolism